MTNQAHYYHTVKHASVEGLRKEHDEYCQQYGDTFCTTCKLYAKMLADPSSVGKSCFAYWLDLDVAETPHDQEPTPSSSSSSSEPEPKSVNNETSFTMLDE